MTLGHVVSPVFDTWCVWDCRGGLWTFWEAHSVPVVMEASFVTLYRAAEDVWLDLQELNETSSTFS